MAAELALAFSFLRRISRVAGVSSGLVHQDDATVVEPADGLLNDIEEGQNDVDDPGAYIEACPLTEEEPRTEVGEVHAPVGGDGSGCSFLGGIAPLRPPLATFRVPGAHLAERSTCHAPVEIRATLKHVVEIALSAPGPCSFVIAPKEAYLDCWRFEGVHFRATDKSQQWSQGYMTTRARGAYVHQEAFVALMHEASERTPDRRWPKGHEAEGLKKDSFTAMLDVDGRCVKCCVAIDGLPIPPMRWDNVNCRHLDGLAVLWLLRRSPAAVVLRCAGGVVTVLLPHACGAIAIGTPAPWLA